ncbi:MAG: hypothetical protein KDA93_25415 [Planctomycetaceae bacterium]|nr:hypothetical protein [Planctomycetaceae bacterium]
MDIDPDILASNSIQEGRSYGTATVLTCRPDEKTEFEWKGTGLGDHVLAACWGIPPGLFLAALCFLTPNPWLLAPLAFLATCSVPGWVDWRFYRPRRFLFDWSAGRIDWTIGRNSGSARLEDVESVELRGLLVIASTTVGVPRVRTHQYAGRLLMRVDGRRVAIADSLEELRPDDEPYRDLRLLQNHLIKELPSATADQSDYRGGGISWVIRRPFFPWSVYMPPAVSTDTTTEDR